MQNDVEYMKPNLDLEWEEALRYKQFSDKPKQYWKDVVESTARVYMFSELGHVTNHDPNINSLEIEKVERVRQEIENGTLQYPIFAKMPDNTYELVAGNTRVAVLKSMNIDPKVMVFDMPDEAKFSKLRHISK